MPDRFGRLAAMVPSRPAGDLDDEQLLAKAHGATRWELTVDELAQLAPQMLRITMSSPGLTAMAWQPAQDLTVHVLRTGGRDIRRRYTIAGVADDRVWIDVYLHGHGLGTTWARSLSGGDTVSAIGPRGKLVLQPQADWHLLIGDETSLPGIHAMLEATDRPAYVVAEVDNPAQWQGLGAGARLATQWVWLKRGRQQHGTDVLTPPCTGAGHAYVTGEAARVLYWRETLQEMGFDGSVISHKAYWGTGHANATHGEPLK